MTTIAARLQPARRWVIESPIAGPLITLIVVFILFSLFVPNFLTVRSISGIVNAATLTGTITIGITLLMIAGEFDLSVGPMMAMGAFLFGLNSVEGGNPILALFLALLVPGVMGAVNGIIVNRTGIPSFITTLSTLFIYRGIVWVLSGGQMFQTIEQAPIYDIFNGRLDFIADAVQGANFRTAALWWVGLVLLFQYLLVRTQFGNHVFATGGGLGAAAAQGVPVKRIKLVCFILSGVLAGFAGVLLFSQFKTVRIATGAGEELKAIAAAVVGGTLLTGGSGSIIGALLGVLIISMLRTGVVLTNLIPADNFEAIVGVTIVGAAIFNHWVREKS
ncbi:MAG: ABC transporter permease [Anaerolineae bacterium]